MATFTTEQEVYDVIGEFLTEVTKDPELRPKFVNADTTFHVIYDDPSAEMFVDCTVDPPQVITGPPDRDAEIELRMAADDGHLFWLGKLNMTVALAKGRVKVKGPISKILKLLPAMRPAFPKYKVFLQSHGHGEKVA